MVTFWNIVRRDLEGVATRRSLPSAPGPSAVFVRSEGSAFFILGFKAISLYAVSCRSSLCTTSLKRSARSARIITHAASLSSGEAIAGPPDGADAGRDDGGLAMTS